MKPNESLASDDAVRFPTLHPSVVLRSAQNQAPGSRTAYANLCRPDADPQAANRGIRILFEVPIPFEGRLGP
jgi:hypothetical protein